MNENKKLEMKSDRDGLIRELIVAGADFRGNSCRCPFCDDKRPSAGVYEKDGFWYFKCHKCGFQGDIFSVMAKNQGITEVEVFKGFKEDRPIKKKKPTGYSSVDEVVKNIRNLKTVYSYKNPKTKKIDLYVFRIEEPGGGKRFIQASHDNNGGIVLKAPQKPLPIYNRTKTLGSKRVVVVEGEKAVHAIAGIDPEICATTSPGGAGKASHADWSPLAGKKVYLWPDNDEVGVKHMDEVANILGGLSPAPEMFLVDKDSLNLPPKGDAVEFFERLKIKEQKAEELQNIVDSAKSIGAASGVLKLFEDIISGKRETIRLPWAGLDEATMALTPGSITLLCGDGGASKSFALIQLCQFWHFELNHDLILYELEENLDYHLRRALAQKTKETRLIDDRWVADNGDHVKGLFKKHEKYMHELGGLVRVAPTKGLSLKHLTKWVDEQARSGKRIICIDPITAASHDGENIWDADKNFLNFVMEPIVESGASLVIVTHPKKGANGAVGMDFLSGGSSWSRHCQTILWLKNLGEEEEMDIIVGGLRTTTFADRVMHVIKSRNSFGGGRNFAMNFKKLTLHEDGEIVKTKKKRKNHD